MSECIVQCPCCGSKIKALINGSGDITTFLLEENSISQVELCNEFGIELGILNNEESNGKNNIIQL